MTDLVYRDDLSEVVHGDCLLESDVAAAFDDKVGGKQQCDALIFDAPYSEKTHAGHKNGKLTSDRAAAWANSARLNTDNSVHEKAYAARKSAAGESGRRDLEYAAFDETKIAAFCSIWLPRCRGWVVSITDDQLAPVWSAAFEAAGLYCFAPLPLVETGSRVRMTGDGPSNWTCWIVVARPKTREFASWGTLPGAYVQAAERRINSREGSARVVGGKPEATMRAIVRDYSRLGQLVADPCAGGGTTLVAAKREGRRSFGMDLIREHCELTARKLATRRHQPSIFDLERTSP